MHTPVFRSQIELEKYIDISVTSGEGLFNQNPSLFVLQQYYTWLISRSNNMKKLICEFNKRTLVLIDKEYEIEPEVAKWLIHKTDIKVVYIMEG